MVSIGTLLESNYVSIELVKESPTKKCVILSEGQIKTKKSEYDESKMVDYFECLVEIDNQQKQYAINKTSLDLIRQSWGNETKNWIGKQLTLTLSKYNGKPCIIATPNVMTHPQVQHEHIN